MSDETAVTAGPRDERVLLTGGAGFIGTRLVRELLPHNDVVVFDNFRRDTLSGSGLMGHPRLTVIRGDVLDAEAVHSAVSNCTMVVHLAAIAGVDTVLKMPVQTMRVNMLGTFHILDAASRLSGLRRLIDISTSEVFGAYAYKVSEGDVTSLGAVGEARWTYAVSKLATEYLALNYHREIGMPCASIRPFNIYGPGQVGEGAVHHFIVRALTGQELILHNDGSQIRAWCYVDDLVRAVLLCLVKENANGQSFNVGNPRSTLTIYNLARLVIQLSGSPSQMRFVPWNSADVELRIPDIGKAAALLGFEPKVDLENGLLKTIEWYRERLKTG